MFSFVLQEECWLPMKTSGFPPGGGLSSHTATLLENKDILIIGREGSARLQRRTGNSFYLRGSVLAGEFKYTDHTMVPASRAGHTSHSIGNVMYIYGGRADEVIETHKGYKGTIQECPTVDRLIAAVSKNMAPVANAKIPCGRKNQVSISGTKGIFIHGGETFDGKSKDPVGDMIVLVIKPQLTWYKLGTSSVGRAAHVCVVYNGDIVIHGGEGAKNVVYGATYKLELNDSKCS